MHFDLSSIPLWSRLQPGKRIISDRVGGHDRSLPRLHSILLGRALHERIDCRKTCVGPTNGAGQPDFRSWFKKHKDRTVRSLRVALVVLWLLSQTTGAQPTRISIVNDDHSDLICTPDVDAEQNSPESETSPALRSNRRFSEKPKETLKGTEFV